AHHRRGRRREDPRAGVQGGHEAAADQRGAEGRPGRDDPRGSAQGRAAAGTSLVRVKAAPRINTGTAAFRSKEEGMAKVVISRRRVIAGAAGAIALGALPRARAQAFPSKNMRVVIPTGQGGGAERLARVFDDFWGPLLKTHFEYSFYAGAAGQVGYELYVHKRERDGYNLLFGNMGPEMIMYALRRPKYRFPDDYQYFCRLDVDDSIVFVRQKSPIRNLEDLAAEAKKRTVNVAVSRLPHPASIGMLALGKAVNARFNLVPYGGGNPTQVAVL